ncbi:hypothetical protein CDD83_7213 [Cordyceps sp. RAO-2017]|nr:hypothetical protein CDD83_7213 [Cordyceps sp. RAO-2017]
MLLEFLSLLALSFIMAHLVPAALIRRLRDMERPESPEVVPAETSPAADDDRFHPTPIDIAVMRIMLVRSKRLPPDLVDSIFDHAEYWAHSTTAVNYRSENHDRLHIRGTGPQQDRFLIRSYPLGLTAIHGDQDLAEELAYDTSEALPRPLDKERDGHFFAKLANYPTPRLVHPCRKIVFSIRSHDQGFGGEPGTRETYNSSWTWFEAGLERFDASQICDEKCGYDVRRDSPSSTAPVLPVCGLRPLQPLIEKSEAGDDGDGGHEYKYKHNLLHNKNWEIHRNLVAKGEWQDHVVTWSYLDDIKPDSDAGMALDEEGRGRETGDGSFVRSLKLGDVVTVWGKARFPGWTNNVESVKVDVYWAV